MKTTKEIVKLNLENEMDLILAHKRSMKLAEFCGLSVSVQTTFATGVSEIARIALGRKRTKKSVMRLLISYSNVSRKELSAEIEILTEDLEQGSEALSYAKRLVDDVTVSDIGRGKSAVRISLQVTMSTLLSPEKIEEISVYFKKEPPLSPYDEIRKKNIQLITLTDKLRESENENRKLTETLPLMMFTLNAMGKITRTNQWFDSFFDGEVKKLTGTSWISLLHPDEQKTAAALWEKTQVEKRPIAMQARLKQKGKNEFLWHMINIVQVKSKAGNVAEWAGFFVDIHAQKVVEETLKNNETLKRTQRELVARNEELLIQKEFVETILDSSVDIIIVCDTEMRFLAFNKKSEQVYRKRKEEVLGKPITEVYPASLGTQSYNDLQRALKGQVIHNDIYYTPFAERYYENFLLPLRDRMGSIYGVLMIAHDITDKVQAEEKLKETNAQLQKSNHDLEQFAYIASHDLQEPLRKIRNFSELLEMHIDNATLRSKYLGKIDHSATRMATLINDVLNYSRLSSVNAEFTAVDLNEVLRNVKVDFELLLEEKHATLNAPELPTIRGVQLQLHQLFYNLISNSLKFSSEKPVIHISSAPVREPEKRELHLDQTSNYIALVFKDNGIGFEQKYAEQIFTIFQRLETDNNRSGTGIGLALCKKIVDKHKGRIIASGKTGEGAEFRVILPA